MFPIEQQSGTRGLVWVAWSMPVEHSPGRSADGLDVFPTYDAAAAECARRNLVIAEAHGYAGEFMPALDGGRGGKADFTYRQFYSARAKD